MASMHDAIANRCRIRLMFLSPVFESPKPTSDLLFGLFCRCNVGRTNPEHNLAS